MSKKRVLTGLGLGVGLGLALVVAGLIVIAQLGPRNVIGMLRYDTRREGSLQVGALAPEIELLDLDGTTRVKLSQRQHDRPLVLIFGSFT